MRTALRAVGLLLATALVIPAATAGTVFLSFLFGLLSMAVFSRREGARLFLALNAVAIAAVAVTLAVNLRRGYPIASLGAACAIALVLHRLWIRAGRPRGVSVSGAMAAVKVPPRASPRNTSKVVDGR